MADSLTGLMELGGYGGFVWPAYGISALAIGLTAFIIVRRMRQLRRRLDAFDEQGRAQGGVKSLSARSNRRNAARAPRAPIKIAEVGPTGAISESSSRTAS